MPSSPEQQVQQRRVDALPLAGALSVNVDSVAAANKLKEHQLADDEHRAHTDRIAHQQQQQQHAAQEAAQQQAHDQALAEWRASEAAAAKLRTQHEAQAKRTAEEEARQAQAKALEYAVARKKAEQEAADARVKLEKHLAAKRSAETKAAEAKRRVEQHRLATDRASASSAKQSSSATVEEAPKPQPAEPHAEAPVAAEPSPPAPSQSAWRVAAEEHSELSRTSLSPHRMELPSSSTSLNGSKSSSINQQPSSPATMSPMAPNRLSSRFDTQAPRAPRDSAPRASDTQADANAPVPSQQHVPPTHPPRAAEHEQTSPWKLPRSPDATADLEGILASRASEWQQRVSNSERRHVSEVQMRHREEQLAFEQRRSAALSSDPMANKRTAYSAEARAADIETEEIDQLKLKLAAVQQSRGGRQSRQLLADRTAAAAVAAQSSLQRSSAADEAENPRIVHALRKLFLVRSPHKDLTLSDKELLAAAGSESEAMGKCIAAGNADDVEFLVSAQLTDLNALHSAGSSLGGSSSRRASKTMDAKAAKARADASAPAAAAVSRKAPAKAPTEELLRVAKVVFHSRNYGVYLQLSDEEILPIVQNNEHLHKLCIEHLDAEKRASTDQAPSTTSTSPSRHESMMSLLDRNKQMAWEAAETSRRAQMSRFEQQLIADGQRRQQAAAEAESHKKAKSWRVDGSSQVNDIRGFAVDHTSSQVECTHELTAELPEADPAKLSTDLADYASCIGELRKVYEERTGMPCELTDEDLVPVLVKDPRALKYIRAHLGSQ